MSQAKIPETFTILGKGLLPKRLARLMPAIELLREAQAISSVRKVELDDAKFVLNAAFEEAWRSHVADRFFYAGKYENQSELVQNLYHDMMASGIHSAISMSKKVAVAEKAGAAGEAIEAMKEVLVEAMPLAETIKDLKPFIVKGRKVDPSAPPKEVKEHKNGTGTCSCCFSGVAITDGGRMAHHGYQRPGYGEQTASCSGIRFQPLEVSTEGLEWLIDNEKAQLEKVLERVANLPDVAEIPVQKHVKGRLVLVPLKKVEADPGIWDRAHRAYARVLEIEQTMLSAAIKDHEALLVEWSAKLAPPEVSEPTGQLDLF